MSGVVEATDATISDVVKAPLALVDVYATWCGPCKILEPVLERIEQANRGRLVVARVDVDRNPATTHALQVQGVPTLALFRDGRMVDRVSGAYPQHAIQQWIDQHGGAR